MCRLGDLRIFHRLHGFGCLRCISRRFYLGLIIIIIIVVVVMIILVFEGSLFLGPVIVLEFNRFESLVDQIHEILPDLSRPGRTLQAAHRFGRIAADPDRGRVIMGKSTEPAVLGIVCRTGLTGSDHAIIQLESAAGSPAFLQDTLQYADHLSGRVLIIDLGRGSIIGINRCSLVVFNRGDTGRNTVFAVIGKRCIAGCHFNRLHAVGETTKAGCQGIVRIHDHGIVHSLELGETVSGRDIIIDLPGNRVQGPLDCFTQFELSHVAAARVFGAVLDLLVLHQRSRIISAFKCGRIDNQRLDGTAGLSVALECAVERNTCIDILLGSSADHGNDLAGAVVDTYSGALQLVLAVVGCIGKLCERFIDTRLQFLLLLHIKGSMDDVSALKELGQAGVIELVVYFVIRGALFIACKIIAEGEVRVLELHENFRRTFIGIREHIGVLIEVSVLIGGQIQRDLLVCRLIILALRNHTVFQHIGEDQISSVDRMVGVHKRVIIGRAVGNRAQISHL